MNIKTLLVNGRDIISSVECKMDGEMTDVYGIDKALGDVYNLFDCDIG